MPIEVKYDVHRKILDISVSGKPDIIELASTLETITHSIDYPPKTNTIWDLRKADLLNVDADMIKQIIEVGTHFIKQRAKIKTALVAAGGLQLAFSRAIQVHAERIIPQEIMYFSDYSDAEQFVLEDPLTE